MESATIQMIGAIILDCIKILGPAIIVAIAAIQSNKINKENE